jgi:hypothetical protein
LSQLFEEGSSETNHKKFDEGTKQLTSDEKIATVRAAAEEASKIADRVKQVLAARRLLSEQKSIAEAPQGNSAEAPTSSEIAPTSSKDIYTQDSSGPCLQWDTTNSKVTGVEIPTSDGTALQVVYNLRVQNICSDPVDNVLFSVVDDWACPADCVNPTGTLSNAFEGSPSSIGQNQFTAGRSDDRTWCTQSDNDGNPISVPPDSVTTTAYLIGEQDGNTIQSIPITLGVYRP